TRVVHPRDAVITGMTRDGTFVVKDGEIAYPVKSLRFTQSYVDALKNTEAIGADRLVLWSEYLSSATCVPALKISDFHFTSGARRIPQRNSYDDDCISSRNDICRQSGQRGFYDHAGRSRRQVHGSALGREASAVCSHGQQMGNGSGCRSGNQSRRSRW